MANNSAGKERPTHLNESHESAGAGGDGYIGQSDLLKLASAIVQQAENGLTSRRRAEWANAYLAYRSQHIHNSKYESFKYRTRSKLFRPKTRAAVRKANAAAAAALFSTEDVVSITAENDQDEMARAGAELKHNLLNYRLDRSSSKSGIPWFLTAIGANQDAYITGICASKQYWEYEEEAEDEYDTDFVEGKGGGAEDIAAPMPEDEYDIFDDPAPGLDQTSAVGEPDELDPGNVVDMAGEPFEPEMEPEPRILKDRPRCELFPPENVIVDPGAPWIDVAQDGAFLILQTPMHIDDVQAMTQNQSGRFGGGAWKDIPISTLAANSTQYGATSVRTSREGGTDRQSTREQAAVNELSIVWVHENFIRRRGIDWHFWSLGVTEYLTDPVPTAEAYPEQGGERPVVIGVGEVESHSVLPRSPVEALQPLQAEANDLVNLALDTIKNTISPIVKVKRGKRIDWKQVHSRGPDAAISVDNMDDVDFVQPGSMNPIAFQQENRLNADFDDLSGSFSSSSVNSNRQLNETVGGMKLMQGNANALTEFDLRVWTETWVERTLRQIVKLEQFYESDEIVLKIAGRKSKMIQKLQLDEQYDELLQSEVNTRVNVGIGAADPVQKLNKFGMAMSMAMEAAPFVMGQVKPKAEAIFEEIFGQAGYRDAARFFEFIDEEVQDQQDEQEGENQIEAAKLQQQGQIEQGKLQQQDKELQSETGIEKAKIGVSREKIASDERQTKMKIEGEMAREKIRMKGNLYTRAMDNQSKRQEQMRRVMGGASNSA